MKRVDFSKAATVMKWSAYAAECIDCIVRPCVQNPWYCLHSPINVFCMVWSCCHGDPRIGRLKWADVCMEGVSERERERSTACMSVDWQTDTGAWHRVCSRLLIRSHRDIIELAVLSCLAADGLFLFIFSRIMCYIVSQLPFHHICCSPARVALSGNVALTLYIQFVLYVLRRF